MQMLNFENLKICLTSLNFPKATQIFLYLLKKRIYLKFPPKVRKLLLTNFGLCQANCPTEETGIVLKIFMGGVKLKREGSSSLVLWVHIAAGFSLTLTQAASTW